MTASLRLFRIEARRNPGLLLFIPIAAIVWLIVKLVTPDQVVLWPEVTRTVRDSAGVIGPAAAGLAAWAAGRGHRARATELLATTPRSPVAREVATWAATSGWGILGWTLGAAVVLVQTTLTATWGAPQSSPLFIALLVIATSTSWGYAAGVWFRSRFTAPLAGVAMFAVLIFPTVFESPVRNLSVFSVLDDGIFFRVAPDLSGLHLAFLLSLTALALGCIVLKYNRNVLGWGAVFPGAAASTVLLVVLAGAEVPEQTEPVPYEPLCAQGNIEVCIHPAFDAMQAQTIDVFDRLTDPLMGIPGAPVRALQVASAGEWGLSPAGVLRFELLESESFLGGGPDSFASHISGVLAYGNACCDEAQEVVRSWLILQAGMQVPVCEQTGGEGFCIPGRFVPELERFAALEPSVRHAWLYDNYAALTRGELTLEDLP